MIALPIGRLKEEKNIEFIFFTFFYYTTFFTLNIEPSILDTNGKCTIFN